jgi:HlyD family secretion protein
VPNGHGRDRASRRFRALVALLVIALIPGIVWTLSWRTSAQAQPAARAVASSSVRALARLEPEGGLVVVGVRPGARVEDLMVKEGDEVIKGAALAHVEGHDVAGAQLALAEAQRKNARHQRAMHRDKTSLEREHYDKTKDAKLAAARKAAEIAHQRLDGTKTLATLAKPTEVRDKAELENARFQAEVQAVEADEQLKDFEVADGLVARIRALEDKQLADKGPDDDVLDRQVEAARVAVDQTVVKAPVAGRVLAVSALAGEISAGPLIYLGDVKRMAAKAEVDQADAATVREGDAAEVIVQGKPVTGKVTYVAGLVMPNQLRDIDPRAVQDLRVIRVTIRLDDASTAARYVNMQVEATIRPRPADAN